MTEMARLHRCRWIAIAAMCVSATLCLAVSQPKIAREFSGKVIRVTDGDTVKVLVDQSPVIVRLEGIDAPEDGQSFSARSKRALETLVAGKTVTIRSTGEDKYGRTLGFVFVDGVNANARMVAEGWAWHYKKYSSDEQLAQLEVSARAARIGLWADPNPLAPWEYRARQNPPHTAASDKPAATTGAYWLNTSSNVRHNARCEYYRNTRSGRPCGPDEGRACGSCGG
jgi:endonuclease YncB( thermonuclease family)